MCFLIEGKTDEELPVSRALGVPLKVPSILTIQFSLHRSVLLEPLVSRTLSQILRWPLRHRVGCMTSILFNTSVVVVRVALVAQPPYELKCCPPKHPSVENGVLQNMSGCSLRLFHRHFCAVDATRATL